MPSMETARVFPMRGALVCPSCLDEIHESEERFSCGGCGRSYGRKDGIPVFVEGSADEHDEIDHLVSDHIHGRSHREDAHKAAQASYFDRSEHVEFEIERPVGTPALYQFLIGEKFRRAVQPMGGRLDGTTALVVCGGSGMDAELLVRAGATVISSDISLGAAKRTRERSGRHGIPITSIVADVEHLPFRDRSFDLVYVHDGLHHLADPELGLGEMARVASRWVSITEPARAAITNFAVRLGLALSREESGNPVARLDPATIEQKLREAGFSRVRSERYAMYYRHHPGSIFARLSRRGLLRPTIWGWRAANAVIGRKGNKLVTFGERR